ncbi:MAG: RHS repeat-associated core domain-containing protein [Pseudomonadota bacterium]
MVEETPVYADGTIAYDAGIQWVYQPGAITPAARYQRGKLHYVVTDHQGTPREMFTENGVASWAGRLNTWGQLAFWESREGHAENDPNYIDCHFRFAGQFEDNETGLYYNRFRYYDKDSGQYISPDPIGLLGGFNPYSYVHNPTKFIDPFGLMVLYRGMHLDEFEQLTKTGKWGAGNGSMEGKWFAESYKDAVTWGERMGHGGDFKVVQVNVSDKLANNAYAVKNLDGIGNARYIEVADLNSGNVRVQWSKTVTGISCCK